MTTTSQQKPGGQPERGGAAAAPASKGPSVPCGRRGQEKQKRREPAASKNELAEPPTANWQHHRRQATWEGGWRKKNKRLDTAPPRSAWPPASEDTERSGPAPAAAQALARAMHESGGPGTLASTDRQTGRPDTQQPDANCICTRPSLLTTRARGGRPADTRATHPCQRKPTRA